MTEKPDYYNQKKPPSSEQKERVCIMCRKNFMSDSARNRFCIECKTTSDYKNGYDAYPVLKR